MKKRKNSEVLLLLSGLILFMIGIAIVGTMSIFFPVILKGFGGRFLMVIFMVENGILISGLMTILKEECEKDDTSDE